MQEQQHFQTSDGTTLFYRHRPAEHPSGRAAVFFHSGGAHSAFAMSAAEESGLEGFDLFAWDARGCGMSAAAKPATAAQTAADAADFVRHIALHHGIDAENLCVVAQGTGAVPIAAWLHDYAPRIRCAVLVSPAFRLKYRIPFAAAALRAAARFNGGLAFKNRVRPHHLSHSKTRCRSYENDPALHRTVTAAALADLDRTARRVTAGAPAVTVPLQLIVAGSDSVAGRTVQHRFFNRLGSRIKERHVMMGFRHDALGEHYRELVFAEMRRFIFRCFDAPFAETDCTGNHLSGASRALAERLATPPSPFSPAAFRRAACRFALTSAARVSPGLNTVAQTGPSSAETLDYAYRNEIQGRNALGTFADRLLLESAAARALRLRTENTVRAVQTASALLRGAGRPVRILDAAAGRAPWLADMPEAALPDYVLLRNPDARHASALGLLVEERGLKALAGIAEADPFDRDSYQNLRLRPTLAIASSLCEHCSDNDTAAQALGGFGDAVTQGGYLVYTNRLRYTAAELAALDAAGETGITGRLLRCRSQQEADQLAARAGFRKIRQWTDKDGIFTVSLAEKVSDGIPPAANPMPAAVGRNGKLWF